MNWKKLHRYLSGLFNTQIKQFWTPGTFKCSTLNQDQKIRKMRSQQTKRHAKELRIREKLKSSILTAFKLNSTYKIRRTYRTHL